MTKHQSPPIVGINAVEIPPTTINHKDILFKMFWTVVSLTVAIGGIVAVDLNPVLATAIGAGVNYITAAIRQYTGVTPPDIGQLPVDTYNVKG